MKKIILLFAFLFTLANLLQAQNKTITLYFNDGSTEVFNPTNLDSIIVFICGESKIWYEGKLYGTVLIGDQCWLKENLDVGTMILGANNQTQNGQIEKYCWGNYLDSCSTRGGLYQWGEAMQYATTEGAQGVCPDGWHIPTLTEFQTLAAEVSYDGNALKAIGQGYDGGAGTNTSGFSALLAGHRTWEGYFYHGQGVFWSSTQDPIFPGNKYRMFLWGYSSTISLNFHVPEEGYSVRCIKD